MFNTVKKLDEKSDKKSNKPHQGGIFSAQSAFFRSESMAMRNGFGLDIAVETKRDCVIRKAVELMLTELRFRKVKNFDSIKRKVTEIFSVSAVSAGDFDALFCKELHHIAAQKMNKDSARSQEITRLVIKTMIVKIAEKVVKIKLPTLLDAALREVEKTQKIYAPCITQLRENPAQFYSVQELLFLAGQQLQSNLLGNFKVSFFTQGLSEAFAEFCAEPARYDGDIFQAFDIIQEDVVCSESIEISNSGAALSFLDLRQAGSSDLAAVEKLRREMITPSALPLILFDVNFYQGLCVLSSKLLLADVSVEGVCEFILKAFHEKQKIDLDCSSSEKTVNLADYVVKRAANLLVSKLSHSKVPVVDVVERKLNEIFSVPAVPARYFDLAFCKMLHCTAMQKMTKTKVQDYSFDRSKKSQQEARVIEEIISQIARKVVQIKLPALLDAALKKMQDIKKYKRCIQQVQKNLKEFYSVQESLFLDEQLPSNLLDNFNLPFFTQRLSETFENFCAKPACHAQDIFQMFGVSKEPLPVESTAISNSDVINCLTVDLGADEFSEDETQAALNNASEEDSGVSEVERSKPRRPPILSPVLFDLDFYQQLSELFSRLLLVGFSPKSLHQFVHKAFSEKYRMDLDLFLSEPVGPASAASYCL